MKGRAEQWRWLGYPADWAQTSGFRHVIQHTRHGMLDGPPAFVPEGSTHTRTQQLMRDAPRGNVSSAVRGTPPAASPLWAGFQVANMNRVFSLSSA